MRTMLKMKALLIGGIAGMTFAASAQQVIYNNTTNDLTTRYTFGTTEIGNEITLAGTARNITLFSFEWWGVNSVHPATFSGAIQARVQFYPNAGPPFNGYATPGTPSSPTASFWDSGWFSVGNPTDRSTFIFTAGSGSDFPVGGLPITVSDMTWTVQFQGMGTGDSVGLDLYGPPSVGTNFRDYWEYSSGSWGLRTNSLAPMSFGAYMTATVPEPSAVAISIIGGLCFLTLARRLRRKE